MSTIPTTTTTTSNSHLQAAGHSIASNIIVQLLSRGFTFVLGAITLKYLQSSSLLGIINVRLALLYSTLQFLSREPFRRACIKEAGKSGHRAQAKWPRVANTIWLGTILSLILSIPLAYLWKLYSPSIIDLAGTTVGDYHYSIIVMCFAVIVEMLAEPCFIYAQSKEITDHNPKVEVTSMILKCFSIALVTVNESSKYKAGQSSYILTKIAICHLVASIVHVIYSYGRIYVKHQLPPSYFFPSFRGSRVVESSDEEDADLIHRYFDRASLKLSLSFMSQTFLKQLLTEGERYVMTFFNFISLSDQGIYDVVNNLGSLVARLLFKPIEDSAYILFSKTVSRTRVLDIRKFFGVQANLMSLIKLMLITGLIVLTFGYHYVPWIVLYGGRKLNNPLAFYLMKWQLFYTPILAVNGVTECFTFAIMRTTDFKIYNYFMVLYSLFFIGIISVTQPILGSACFILANCVIMILRIIFSYTLIRGYFKKHGYILDIKDSLPSLTTFTSLTGVSAFLSVSQFYLTQLGQPYSTILGLFFGGWCLSFMNLCFACHEKELIDFVFNLFELRVY